MDRKIVRKIKSKQAKKKIPVVFISHYAQEDSELAKKFKQWIETHYKVQRVKVFASSAGNCIKTGTFFMSRIGQMLTMKDVLISLLSPASMSRPWVIFETGAGVCAKALLPILCKGAQKKDLAPPFQELQIKDASNPSQFNEVLCELDKALGGKHTDVGVDELRHCLCSNTKGAGLEVGEDVRVESETVSIFNSSVRSSLPPPSRHYPLPIRPSSPPQRTAPQRSGPPIRPSNPPRPKYT